MHGRDASVPCLLAGKDSVAHAFHLRNVATIQCDQRGGTISPNRFQLGLKTGETESKTDQGTVKMLQRLLRFGHVVLHVPDMAKDPPPMESRVTDQRDHLWRIGLGTGASEFPQATGLRVGVSDMWRSL